MAENLMNMANKTSNDAYREGWDRVFGKQKNCESCKFSEDLTVSWMYREGYDYWCPETDGPVKWDHKCLYFEEAKFNDPHIGCPAWPNCDESPLGCSVLQKDKVEWYGHRD